MLVPPPRPSTLSPYTTLFRSVVLPSPVPGDVGVAEGEVADHDVGDLVEMETASDDLCAAPHPEDAGVGGHREVRPEGLHDESALDEHRRRALDLDRTGELLGIAHHMHGASVPADGPVRQLRSGEPCEARGGG